jgi:hypothetical protein
MLPLNEVRSDLGFLWELKCGGGCSVLLRKGFDVCFIVIDSGTHREKKVEVLWRFCIMKISTRWDMAERSCGGNMALEYPSDVKMRDYLFIDLLSSQPFESWIETWM